MGGRNLRPGNGRQSAALVSGGGQPVSGPVLQPLLSSVQQSGVYAASHDDAAAPVSNDVTRRSSGFSLLSTVTPWNAGFVAGLDAEAKQASDKVQSLA